jgi:hypothetical protein
MHTDSDLRQAAIDELHRIMKSRKTSTRQKAELGIEILSELREAQAARLPPDWVQEMLVEQALEDERERKNRWRD